MSIIQANNISPIEEEFKNVNKSSLVIFDCDDVLTTVKVGMFKPQNREILEHYVNNKKISKSELYDKLRIVLTHEDNVVVNPLMIDLVKQLTEHSVRQLVLTAYSVKPTTYLPNPIQWRINQLNELGYRFEKLWPVFYFVLEDFLCKYCPTFKDGILCCDIFPKSECLELFLKQIHWIPEKIVFIDDSLKNLVDVEAFCKREGIKYIGIQYLESQYIKSYIPFSEQLGKTQIDSLINRSVWLSDEEANETIS